MIRSYHAMLFHILLLGALGTAIPNTGVVYAQAVNVGAELSLDGEWQTGIDRVYNLQTPVPGLPQDPGKPSPGTLWYKRRVQLPQGDWTQAVLTLKGARFAPQVYVNGQRVSSSGGGMAPTVHVLRSSNIRPGAQITLEVALASLNTLDPSDASLVPQPDRWRSDNSSGLWDDVSLHLAGPGRIDKMTPFVDFANRVLNVHWSLAGRAAQVKALLYDKSGRLVGHSTVESGANGIASLPLASSINTWEPEHPVLYRLRLEASDGSMLLDSREMPWGLKSFETHDRRFFLNGHPIEMRGGTVVWHRFLRFPEARTLAFDAPWFRTNIMLRLKSHGANMLRFHLGLPPDRLLDLCDQEGLMVQMEWPFFHGIKASDESMREQWQAWLDVAMRHPSVMIIHPWNETDGDELKAGWKAMNAVLANYPPLVVAHRDTIHIHKYWWSLFENLGLYYDSANQFDRTIMVDEFGGNYLDQNGDAGLYPSVKETFLRFLGRNQTRDMRLEFQAESNARVGEYWRRLGAAGIAPFCILGSPQDGDSWFLGPLKSPTPMPVWEQLTATFSPQSVSLDVWDRNFAVSHTVRLPLFFFNDTSAPALLKAHVRIVRADGTLASTQTISAHVEARGRTQTVVDLAMPDEPGAFRFEAVLLNKVEGVTHPIISIWNFRTLVPQIPETLVHTAIGVPDGEPELRAFILKNGLQPVAVNDPAARVIVTSAHTWERLASTPKLVDILSAAVNHGKGLVMLDIGPSDLGQGYRRGDLGPLDGAPRIQPGEGYKVSQLLFNGVRVTFDQVAEPESHLQPGPADASLWTGLPNQSAWLWNGLRGGLTSPAADMEVEGLGATGYLAEWTQRGADSGAIARGPYYAFQLAGYYAFSARPDDAATIEALKARVKFLVDDAPALAAAVNPNAKVTQINLSTEYRKHAAGQVQQLIPLATCGKNLTRTSIAELVFGSTRGNVILSQVLTAGRLVRGASAPGEFGLRYDPAVEQMVLNMLAKAISPVPSAPATGTF